MDTVLVSSGPKAWTIHGADGHLGELREIRGLFVLIPSAGSPLDDVKGGYGSQAAAIEAIGRRMGVSCTMAAQNE